MDDHDLGLAHDLQRLRTTQLQRRRALLWLAGAGTLPLLGCGGGGDDAGATTTGGGNSACTVIPEETAGPYPGDGSNTSGGSIANALALSGIVRSDIRSSVAGAGATAEGVLLTLTLTLVNANASCADLSGFAIYLWHCTREGGYSMYSADVADQNFLRGVQETDADGQVAFTTIFPGCYAGRMPHMHFEVYPNLAGATSAANKIKTSQIAFPTDACATVYAGASGYSASAANFAQISFATDNVFRDGYSSQLVELSGSVAAGYSAALTVAINA